MSDEKQWNFCHLVRDAGWSMSDAFVIESDEDDPMKTIFGYRMKGFNGKRIQVAFSALEIDRARFRVDYVKRKLDRAYARLMR